jgi:hypothetical protein
VTLIPSSVPSTKEDIVRRRLSLPLALALTASALAAVPATASATPSCVGQFFSEHAGSGAAGVTVGGFIAPTARELRAEFGATISGARELPREDCGL